MRIPKAQFNFGQRVVVQWYEIECGKTEATITGINYDHRRGGDGPRYTITEDNGCQTDDITENMMSSANKVISL